MASEPLLPAGLAPTPVAGIPVQPAPSPGPSSAPSPGQQSNAPSATEVLASTIAAAVERQLTHYMGVMSRQIEATRQAADDARADADARLAALAARLDDQQQAAEAYQRALQAALEERLAEFANHQHLRLTDLDRRLAQVPSQVQADLPAQVAVATSGLREYLEHQTAAMDARLAEVQRHTQRFDEQVVALVQHVNQTVQTLAKRIEDGDQVTLGAVDERLAGVRAAAEQLHADGLRQLAEQGAAVNQRIDTTDMKITDRMLAMEQRVNDQAGTKIAALEAHVGRLGTGFDEAMGALSQRMVGLDGSIHELHLRLDEMGERLAKVDADALEEMKERLSTAVGEAMLVRIELDRLVASTDEKLDKQTLRMSEIEALLTDEMDVSAAVQLERLDELERAVAALDPDQFVRKVDPNVGSGAGAPSMPASTSQSSQYGDTHEPTFTY